MTLRSPQSGRWHMALVPKLGVDKISMRNGSGAYVKFIKVIFPESVASIDFPSRKVSWHVGLGWLRPDQISGPVFFWHKLSHLSWSLHWQQFVDIKTDIWDDPPVKIMLKTRHPLAWHTLEQWGLSRKQVAHTDRTHVNETIMKGFLIDGWEDSNEPKKNAEQPRVEYKWAGRRRQEERVLLLESSLSWNCGRGMFQPQQ